MVNGGLGALGLPVINLVEEERGADLVFVMLPMLNMEVQPVQGVEGRRRIVIQISAQVGLCKLSAIFMRVTYFFISMSFTKIFSDVIILDNIYTGVGSLKSNLLRREFSCRNLISGV